MERILKKNLAKLACLLFALSPLTLHADSETKTVFNKVELMRLSDQGAQHGLTTKHPVLLQFWASWCHSCGSVMWDMDEIAKQQPKSHYFSVSIDDNPKDAFAAMKDHKLFNRHGDRYFVDNKKQLSEYFQVESVPTIILLDSKGDVVHRFVGHLNAEERAKFKKHLKNLNADNMNEVVKL